MLYIILQPPISTLFPYTTLFRSERGHGRSYANAVRVSKRQDRRPRREGEHAADESVPRAGIRRRNVRARVPDGRARGAARPRSARAPPPELRRLDERQAVLLEEPDGVLQPRGETLGETRRGARALG